MSLLVLRLLPRAIGRSLLSCSCSFSLQIGRSVCGHAGFFPYSRFFSKLRQHSFRETRLGESSDAFPPALLHLQTFNDARRGNSQSMKIFELAFSVNLQRKDTAAITLGHQREVRYGNSIMWRLIAIIDLTPLIASPFLIERQRRICLRDKYHAIKWWI